jgi:hypothetical protein
VVLLAILLYHTFFHDVPLLLPPSGGFFWLDKTSNRRKIRFYYSLIKGVVMSFDRNDQADLTALKNEVDNDPLGIGYAPDAGTSIFLDLLNAKNYTVEKPLVSSADFRGNTPFDAFGRLQSDDQNCLVWKTGSNGYDHENVPVTDDIKQKLAGDPVAADSIWAVQDRTEMNAVMSALINVPGSRAEVLFGYGTLITRDDWFAARDNG